MPPFRTRLARYLRRTMSPTQSRLWDRLRMRQVGGWKFRRQHPIGPYFVDFYCPAARLVVQIVSSTPEASPVWADAQPPTVASLLMVIAWWKSRPRMWRRTSTAWSVRSTVNYALWASPFPGVRGETIFKAPTSGP